MKKILTILTLLLVAVSASFAQDAEAMKKAQAKFKNMQTLEADVVMTKHNTMVTKDVTSKGKFYFKKPSKMCLLFNGGADMMLMNGDNFTMVKEGKKQSVSGKGNSQFEALKGVMQSFSAGEETEVDLSDIADVDVQKNGNLVTMTITPILTDAKQKRKMMFTSFVVVVDTKASELKSLRTNEKGQNYTQYDFSNFKLNSKIEDSVFVAQ